MYKLLKTITGRYLFYNKISLPRRPLWCHALWKFGNSKCCVFKRRHGAENLYKDLIFVPLQPVIPLKGPRYFDFRIWWCHGENTPIDRWRHESATGSEQSQPRAFLMHRKWKARPSYTPNARRACEDRALRGRKTLTLHILFIDFFTCFEKKHDCPAVQTHCRVYRTVLNWKVLDAFSALPCSLQNSVRCLQTNRSLDIKPSTDHPSVLSDQKALSEIGRSIPRVINTSSRPVSSVNFNRMILKKLGMPRWIKVKQN